MSEGQNSKRLQKVKKVVKKKVILYRCNTFLVLHGISLSYHVLIANFMPELVDVTEIVFHSLLYINLKPHTHTHIYIYILIYDRNSNLNSHTRIFEDLGD